jgi:hypothetical protein
MLQRMQNYCRAVSCDKIVKKFRIDLDTVDVHGMLIETKVGHSSADKPDITSGLRRPLSVIGGTADLILFCTAGKLLMLL